MMSTNTGKLTAAYCLPSIFAMKNADVAAAFELIADILEFQGANSFRVRAYRNASRTIHDLSEPVAKIVADSGAN